MTAASTTAPSTAAPSRLTARERTVIGVLLVSTFVVILNETIMGVAIPTLMTQLHITANTAQWLSTAFMLTMAVVIPVTGFLIQRIPTRTLFATALILFSTGTALAAFAPGFPVLVAARVIQGSGTAIMFPLLMTTVMTIVPAGQRGRIMGFTSMVISVAPAIGPVVSGVIITLFGWRWMFGLVLPIALVALIIGFRLISQVGEPKKVPIDVVSVPLAAFGFGGLVYALNAIGAQASGGQDVAPVIPAVIGGVALALFVARQLVLQRSDRALLDFRPFRSRVFTASTITISVLMVAMLGTFILLPLYLQDVLGIAPLAIGLMMLPGGVIMGVLGPVVGRIYDRVGPRPILLPGAVIVVGALGLFSMFGVGTPWWVVVGAHMVLSIGLATAFTPLFTAGLGAVPPSLTSYGSAIFGTLQQVGGAAGTALVVTLAAIGAAQSGATGADATQAGLHLAFTVSALIAVGGLVAAVFVGRPPAAEHPESPAPAGAHA